MKTVGIVCEVCFSSGGSANVCWRGSVESAYFGVEVQKPDEAQRTQSVMLVQSESELHGGPCCPGTHFEAGGVGGDGPPQTVV